MIPHSLLDKDAGVSCDQVGPVSHIFLMATPQWRKITPEREQGETIFQ